MFRNLVWTFDLLFGSKVTSLASVCPGGRVCTCMYVVEYSLALSVSLSLSFFTNIKSVVILLLMHTMYMYLRIVSLGAPVVVGVYV